MKKNFKKVMRSIKGLEVEKKSWSIYKNFRDELDLFDESEEEKSKYIYEVTLARIKCYDCEIKRLKSIITC